MAKIKRPTRWFLISGVAGVLVAALLYALGAASFGRLVLLRIAPVLCPAMILGLAEPSSPGATALLLTIVFGTNFLLYGVVGLALCGAWSVFRPASQAVGGAAQPK
jgi:hypothetical protein